MAPNKCHIFTFPFKVRQQIFSYIVDTNTDVVFKTNHILNYLRNHRRFSSSYLTLPSEKRHAIARGNRQLRDEVTAYYYSNNKFCFYSTYDLHAFLENIQVESRRAISRMFIWWDYSMANHAFNLMQSCVGLRKLEIYLMQRHEGEGIWEMDGLAEFRKIRVGKKNEKKGNFEIEFLRWCAAGEWGPWWTPGEVETKFSEEDIEEFRKVLVEELDQEVSEAERMREWSKKRRERFLRERRTRSGVDVGDEELKVLREMGAARRKVWESKNSESEACPIKEKRRLRS